MTSHTNVYGTNKHRSPDGVDVEVEGTSVVNVKLMVDLVIVVGGGNRLEAVNKNADRKTAVKQVSYATVVS